MPVAWHSRGWWDWSMSEDEKNEKIFFWLTKKNYKVSAIVSTKINTLMNCKLLSSPMAKWITQTTYSIWNYYRVGSKLVRGWCYVGTPKWSIAWSFFIELKIK